MSSELLDIDDDENGTAIMLSMNAHCYAWLTTMEAELPEFPEMDQGESKLVRYTLSPDEKGWQAAEAIAQALLGWVEHSKRIKND